MRKIYSLVLMAVGLLIGTQGWANYIMPEIEAKPAAPEINEVLNTPRRAPSGDAVVVAKVGSVEYTSLQAALMASSQQTPAIIQDDCNVAGTTLSSGSAYLDLNGKVIDFGDNYITLNGTATLTIVDNSAEHTGQIKSSQKWGAFDIYKGATLNLFGGWVNCSGQYGIYQNHGTSSEAGGYCTVNIDGDYTKVTAQYYVLALMAYNHLNIKKGQFYGYVYDVVGNGNEHNTEITIEDGTFEAAALCIYHPQDGKLTINGGDFTCENTAVEMRAGELIINGGTFSTTDPIKATPNGSGATTDGSAIAASQHTTKLPIFITVNDGTFSGSIAIMQVNPQDNSEGDYIKMKVNVNGGKFMSTHTTSGFLYKDEAHYGTVSYADDAMCISQNKRIFLMGGFYNYDPVEFVATGYKCYPITESDYPTEYTAGYRYRVGEIDQAGEQETTVNSGNWKTEATTVWKKGGETGTEPTDETPVVITDNKQVVVTTPATAYSVTLGNGTSNLTVKENGRLMVGAGGFTGTTNESFIVEDGGQMAISPATNDYQPEATVELTVDWARRKVSADDKEQGSLVAEDDLYWQHIATPLSNGVAPTLSVTGVSLVNTWNLVNGWEGKTKDDIVSPFVGYQVSSIKKSDDEKITYTFKGKLVGNHADPMRFARIGFSFFGNSYLAPIDIRELLTCLESKGAVDPTVLLYDSENGIYESINRASYYIPGTKAEIQPMQGFFVFAESATNVDFDYRRALWDAFCAKAATPAMAPAKAPEMQENPFSAIACIDVQAESGAKDRVMLFEGENLSDAEDKGYDAHKMMAPGMNLYAKGSYADLAILATDNLLGSELVLQTDANTNYTIRFANIQGEYALYDALTGVTTNMEEGATYHFDAQANATITNRFYIVGSRKAPTAVDNVEAKTGNCKFMKDGVMYIERNNHIYNAQGQIVK